MKRAGPRRQGKPWFKSADLTSRAGPGRRPSLRRVTRTCGNPYRARDCIKPRLVAQCRNALIAHVFDPRNFPAQSQGVSTFCRFCRDGRFEIPHYKRVFDLHHPIFRDQELNLIWHIAARVVLGHLADVTALSSGPLARKAKRKSSCEHSGRCEVFHSDYCFLSLNGTQRPSADPGVTKKLSLRP